ncbi:MAG: DNA mismatch repair protein MutS [Clostridiales bacterium]|nr:DNA mismatch repair protein MutS [Clostridiales bacterium]
MNDPQKALEFDLIKEKLCTYAHSARACARLRGLAPSLSEAVCRRRMADTTAARGLLDRLGTPPLPRTDELEDILALCEVDAMLLPDQLTAVATFAASCRRTAAYLARGLESGLHVARYGEGILDLSALSEDIERSIRGGQVDSGASPALRDIRRKMEQAGEQIKEKLAAMLRGNPNWFSEPFVAQRNGRYVLPVKKAFKGQFPGRVVETSGSGGTFFMEPASVGRLQAALETLQAEEEAELRRILYALTAQVAEQLPVIRANLEIMEELDVLFAKARLSADMRAVPAAVTADRSIRIRGGRHPLIDRAVCVPIDFEIGDGVRGVVITGPNTGGKTVALKTVGLLSMMAQSGLHIPAQEGSSVCLQSGYYCDIGDSQSILENLSTFSGHLTNIVDILARADHESLVILDELGSGTDPAEGMGIAVAVLEELRRRGCLFLATTHHPQIKGYAARTEGVLSARMVFDRETLSPLYRLELGQAGESCALYIAQKLGLAPHLLRRAYEEAYRTEQPAPGAAPGFDPGCPPEEEGPPPERPPSRLQRIPPEAAPAAEVPSFTLGDSVRISPEGELGIVYAQTNAKGEVGVRVKGVNRLVNHKRVTLQMAAEELYPEDYDLSIVLDTVENRKARHQMGKRHRPDLKIELE